jgi:hypothetical protein
MQDRTLVKHYFVHNAHYNNLLFSLDYNGKPYISYYIMFIIYNERYELYF